MGHSETINVIGRSKPEKLEDGYTRYNEIHAMTKLEMAQKKKRMKESGVEIVEWYAQTKQGCKMLGAEPWDQWMLIPDSEVKHIKTIVCPVCGGKGGSEKDEHGVRHLCVVCNGSGITKNKHWNKWRDWQIQSMKEEFGTA